jgi:phosphate acetyltransferase
VKSLYVTSQTNNAGTLSVILYLMEILRATYKRVAFFKPIVDGYEDIEFIIKNFHLDMQVEDAFGATSATANEMIAENEESFLEMLVQKYNALAETHDFVLIGGRSRDGVLLYGEDINLHIAKNFSSPILLVLNAQEMSDLSSEIDIEHKNIIASNNSHLATVINRSSKIDKPVEYGLFFVPEMEEFHSVSFAQIIEETEAKVLFEGNIQKPIKGVKIASMRIEHFVNYVENDDLVIVGGDRVDIILGCLAMLSSKNAANVSGLLLSGNTIPKEIYPLVAGFTDLVPIVHVNSDTYTIAKKIENIRPKVVKLGQNRLSLLLGKFEDHIDRNFFLDRFKEYKEDTVTPLMFKYGLFKRAKEKKMRIVLPELDDRILRASEIVLHRGIVEIIFVGDEAEYQARADFIGVDISEASILNPHQEHQMIEQFTDIYYALRQHKGLKREDAKELMLSDQTYFATMLVHLGYADGMVSGAIHTTADTVRPALQIIKTTEDTPIVSSLFFMAMDTRVLVFADCAINPDPTAEELAAIAISTHGSATLFDIDPKIAMLSYSTGSSGSGVDVEKVKEATQIVKNRRPDILIEGPIQFDSAVDEDVAKLKLPDSKVAGHATLFIFPDLNTGNNTYKAVQRSAKAVAIGPILQGLNRPVNDLSRGCLIEDIVNTVAITAIQAQGVE